MTPYSLALAFGAALALAVIYFVEYRRPRRRVEVTDLDRWRAVLAEGPTCVDDQRIGRRVLFEGASDRQSLLVPRLAQAYGSYRTWLAREGQSSEEYATLKRVRRLARSA